ncbi:MAG TPA: protein kinase, partial [Kofleriaceae bacterium]|nr:protein kinase [Kofleriaceae bacterium]
MLGRILGNYRLQAHIGSGGMGIVYRGEHTLIGRRAAVKVLLPEYSTRKDLIRRFFNEAKAAASAQHPGIVEVYDFGQAGDGTAYLIMELLEGDTLWQRLRKAKRLEERLALVIARQIAAALAAAHQAGVIHRDLKPGNIFLLSTDEPGGLRVKLMDFGVAKLMREDSFGEGLTTTGAIVGTPTFMSPEQCRGGGTPIDWRSDLYSLGCIMFSMLTGRPPFTADGHGAVLAMHIYEPAPRVKDFQPVSDDVDRLVSQLLSKRPEDRASEIREVAGILAEMAPTEEGRRRSPAAAPALVPTVLDDSAATTPRATQPGEVTAPVAHALATAPPAGGAPAFVVPASAVPALAAAVPVLRRDKPVPVAFPRPATTLKPGAAPPATAPSSSAPPALAAGSPLPSSPSSPAAGPLAPTLKPSTPAPPAPGGGVAVPVAITVPASAAAPPPPNSIIPAQQARRRVETPAAWPDGTPTARTTMPPRALRGRGAGPVIAVVLALALFGGSLFAAFQLGVFGGDRPA